MFSWRWVTDLTFSLLVEGLLTWLRIVLSRVLMVAGCAGQLGLLLRDTSGSLPVWRFNDLNGGLDNWQHRQLRLPHCGDQLPGESAQHSSGKASLSCCWL
jgi:hypothetical protein